MPRGRGTGKPKFLKESMKVNWNFQRGGEGGLNRKKPCVVGVWIFSGTTHSSMQNVKILFLSKQFNKLVLVTHYVQYAHNSLWHQTWPHD